MKVIVPNKETFGYIQKHFWDAAKHVAMQRTASDNRNILPKMSGWEILPKEYKKGKIDFTMIFFLT